MVCLPLYHSSLVKMFNSGFVRMINHDASAFARAVQCSFLPQQAVTGCKCPFRQLVQRMYHLAKVD